MCGVVCKCVCVVVCCYKCVVLFVFVSVCKCVHARRGRGEEVGSACEYMESRSNHYVIGVSKMES